jgi:pyruvate formate lyase activating enzyme
MKSEGRVFSIERYAINDGEGIRTNVFLKGCPMRCLWCANPEGISYGRKLLQSANRCIECHECIKICPAGAIISTEKGISINRGLCTNCGACAEQCYSGALELDSRDMTVSDVLSEVLKDVDFYRLSGSGGVTLSGGEPLYQADFSRELLKSLKEMSIHTTLETCGDYHWSIFKKVISYLDMAYFDLKHIDNAAHRRITGRDNFNVIANLKELSREVLPAIIRIPIVPGLNDAEENIRQIARFARTLGNIKEIELLSYHQLGVIKYRKLGLNYSLAEVVPPGKQYLIILKDIVQSEGLICTSN